MVNWLRKFEPNAAKILKPITDLTSKSHSEVVKWGWISVVIFASYMKLHGEIILLRKESEGQSSKPVANG